MNHWQEAGRNEKQSDKDRFRWQEEAAEHGQAGQAEKAATPTSSNPGHDEDGSEEAAAAAALACTEKNAAQVIP